MLVKYQTKYELMNLRHFKKPYAAERSRQQTRVVIQLRRIATEIMSDEYEVIVA